MTTAILSPTPAARVLMQMKQQELDQLFLSLEAPQVNELDGAWQGRLMALSGLGWLPRPLASMLWSVLATPLNPWRGKAFGDGRGSNQLLRSPGVSIGHYTVKQSVSSEDDHPIVLLNYDVPANPSILRPVRGEVRRLGPNRMLARMNWQTGQGPRRVLYFTLQQDV